MSAAVAQAIAEVPEPLAALITAHLCPNCRAIYRILKVDGCWKIERVLQPAFEAGSSRHPRASRTPGSHIKTQNEFKTYGFLPTVM